jgi:hypothetical protein
MPPARTFAVMLYAGIAVAGAKGVSAAEGRAMVTITDQAFQINATATFFQLKDNIRGDLAVIRSRPPSCSCRTSPAS